MISENRFLSTEEVAERLRVDEQTVRRWIKHGKLEAFKVGRAWRISPAALEALLESHSSPKSQTLRESRSEPTAGDSSFGENRTLEERRLLSSLHPFTTPVEARTEYWQRLAESGQVNQYTLEYATEELGLTAQSFKALVDAAIAEHWSGAELGLLGRVYESIAGPYREAWNALMEAWVGQAGAADAQGSRRLRLVADADKAMRVVEEAGEAARAAA